MPMPAQKAILWDMDGVLADTSPLHFQTWERVLSELSIPFDRQKFRHIFGLKNDDLLAYLGERPAEAGVLETVRAYRQRYGVQSG